MGGQRETIISQTKSQEIVGDIRIHESAGEVHFHDDQRQLKVAVPVATWFHAFQNNLKNLTRWQYLDIVQGTLLTVNFRFTAHFRMEAEAEAEAEFPQRAEKNGAAKIELDIFLVKVDISDQLLRLNKFTLG